MQHFKQTLHHWYKLNKRELPWRYTKDPYKIWISEIILQQTRVQHGISYYEKFIERFPTIMNLAKANEDEVLKLWQGLGYYSRARNLHQAAKSIIKNFNGKFPDDYQDILSLKGIGPYTAAAIASIAFGLHHATVDGNVYRVLSRYFGIETPIDSTSGKKFFGNLADELILDSEPGMHNQALMEFGALQCVPKNPECGNCPLGHSCFAAANKMVNALPVKEKKTKQNERFFYYYLLDDGKYIYLEKRTANDIWKNLYQFPLIELDRNLSEAHILEMNIPFIRSEFVNIVSVSGSKKHILSHQIIHARLIHVEISENAAIPKSFVKVKQKDISKFAIPRLLELFIEALDF